MSNADPHLVPFMVRFSFVEVKYPQTIHGERKTAACGMQNAGGLVKYRRSPLLHWQQEGGGTMLELLTSFFQSVLAGLVANMITRWLDGNNGE